MQVSHIDVKKESPVGHGRVTCFSMYCGGDAEFGIGKGGVSQNQLWVDTMQEDEVGLSS